MLCNFCTLFDSNYLARALVMYQSLVATEENFCLYVICLDDITYNALFKLGYDNIIPIPLEEFESTELLKVKGTRSKAEYCWTCTPHSIRYVMDTFDLKQVTYIDADLCFYDKPSILLEEFKNSNASVLITEHRYTPVYDQSKTSGIYCVQFMTFNADIRGKKALQWWQDRCLEWCYARLENGKFGDQKYLDDWLVRFDGVHVLNHLGGGVAPWNIQQYKLSVNNSQKLLVNDTTIVFYHFHGYKYYANGVHDFSSSYRFDGKIETLLYYPYGRKLLEAHQEIQRVLPNFDSGWSKKDKSLLGTLNI